MALWLDIAKWVGPTQNRTAKGMADTPRGIVEHIAGGSYDGTISWQKNNVTGSNRTSSHFIVARDGRIAQMVDTADASWAQRAGNGTWLSIENEGRIPGGTGYKPGLEWLTPEQIEANAKLFARMHREYGTPLQLATSPSGRGLGHHSMGAESGADWGHSACPGPAIKSQKAAILARAIEILSDTNPAMEDDDMGASFPSTEIPPAHGSYTIPPVEGGAADPRAAWLNVCNDTFGERYALRIWLSKGDKSFEALPGGQGNGLFALASGERLSVQLPAGTCNLTISRKAINSGGTIIEPDADYPAYTGHLTFCIERGPVIKS